jgi:hypothetical protein
LAERIITKLGDFQFSCLHVRRNDFQFEDAWTPAKDIVANTKRLFKPNEKVCMYVCMCVLLCMCCYVYVVVLCVLFMFMLCIFMLRIFMLCVLMFCKLCYVRVCNVCILLDVVLSTQIDPSLHYIYMYSSVSWYMPCISKTVIQTHRLTPITSSMP